jgi:hypothetical protein
MRQKEKNRLKILFFFAAGETGNAELKNFRAHCRAILFYCSRNSLLGNCFNKAGEKGFNH